MLIINKSASTAQLLVTTSEISTTSTGSTLNVFSTASNVTSSFNLPTDTSPYPDRYNKYSMPITAFSGLTTGRYNYTITNGGVVTESGVMDVIDNLQTEEQKVESNYVFINDTTDDTYIIYQ